MHIYLSMCVVTSVCASVSLRLTVLAQTITEPHARWFDSAEEFNY